MENKGFSGPIQANPFHTGSTCPYCQETISEGQLIVTCNSCNSLHHDSCWGHHRGCSSYHCDKKVSTAISAPELVITDNEVQNVTVPTPSRPIGPGQAATPYLPPKPNIRSKMGIFTVFLAIMSTTGLVGVLAKKIALIVLGLCTSLATIMCGVIAMVTINNNRRVYGMPSTASGTLLGIFFLIFYFACLGNSYNLHHRESKTELRMSENRPSEADLLRMEPGKADALRANVVIKSQGDNLFTGTSYGSGIITKGEDRRIFVLTNKHVIGEDDNADIEVVFYNGETSKASVVWRAPGDVDLAFLVCQSLTLQRISISVESSIIGQGKRVFAVGNPMNLAWSYTEGVISGIRYQGDIAIYQTQTPLNFGNSGGGLYDMAGKLIGINTWTQDKSKAEGLSFAISTQGLLELLGRENQDRFLQGE